MDETGAPGHPLWQFMSNVRKGEFVTEAAEEIAQVVEAVRRTGRAGTVSIKFGIKPQGNSEDGVVFVRDEVVARAPRPEKRDTVFFATDDGRLSRQDPRQSVLPGIREVARKDDVAPAEAGEAIEQRRAEA